MGVGARAVEDLGLRQFIDQRFWKDRRVFVTGHTGFKGAWLALWLTRIGAIVHGYALAPDNDSVFKCAGVDELVESTIGDIRDRESLGRAVQRAKPEIVFHLAAEALVKRAFLDPAACFDTNVMGTVNLLEALRASPPAVVLITTTDKVYQNEDRNTAFTEDAPLGGREPYGASKVGQEMVALGYAPIFLERYDTRLATARAGNVIGGGDFAQDRIIPDLVRAFLQARAARIRSPDATRPWQYVLDCLAGYLLYAEALFAGELSRSLNFGPRESGVTVRELADAMAGQLGTTGLWMPVTSNGPIEAKTLTLDTSRAAAELGWYPSFTFEAAIADTTKWYRLYAEGHKMRDISLNMIDQFMGMSA
jgi:CDP-glucose 4,6-dehydratase